MGYHGGDGTPRRSEPVPVVLGRHPSVADGPRPRDGSGTKVVFIAASSYSGSTLLGLLLGTDPGAAYLGEPDQFRHHRDPARRDVEGFRVCTCGQRFEVCSFWSPVLAQNRDEERLDVDPGFSLSNLRLLLRILNPLHPRRKRQRHRRTRYARLLEGAFLAAARNHPGLEFVVDSSKSMKSLDALLQSGIDVTVIHLVRDCAEVASSYKSRGHGTLYAITAWALYNVSLVLYARRERLPLLAIDYAGLCHGAQREMDRLNEVLGTELMEAGIAERVRREPYHLLGGNESVRMAMGEFPGLSYRDHRDRLGRFERFAAAGVDELVNALLRRISPDAGAG